MHSVEEDKLSKLKNKYIYIYIYIYIHIHIHIYQTEAQRKSNNGRDPETHVEPSESIAFMKLDFKKKNEKRNGIGKLFKK
jgi:hypothetical protein